MKRILLTLAAVALLAGQAHAIKVISYNPTYRQPIRVLAEWYPSGWTTRSVSYSYNAQGCLVVSVNTYVFGLLVGTETTELCP